MTYGYAFRRKHARLLSAFLALLFASASFAQTNGKAPAPNSSSKLFAESARFIVAFELSPEKGFHFTWPYESMKPSPYGIVLMKVRKMPRLMDERNRQSKLLPASKYLKVNGALQRPLRLKPAEPGEFFEVKLQQGRLRFSLLLPEGATLDPQFKVARIELYEINKVRQP